MNQDIKINEYQSVVGCSGTELGEIFDFYIRKYGAVNTHFICSCVYNLGRIHGKREERTRRKRGGQRKGEECSPAVEVKSEIDCESPDRAKEFYREGIVEMVGKIYDEKFLKMAYGFIKRLYEGGSWGSVCRILPKKDK